MNTRKKIESLKKEIKDLEQELIENETNRVQEDFNLIESYGLEMWYQEYEEMLPVSHLEDFEGSYIYSSDVIDLIVQMIEK